MSLTILISIPLIGSKTLSVPNDKIEEMAGYLGVTRGDETDAEFAKRLLDQIVWVIKRPIIQAKARKLSANPDITDVITEA